MQTQYFQTGNTPPMAAQMIRSAVSELDQIVLIVTQYNSTSQQEELDPEFLGTPLQAPAS
jgi:hypothetical protein